MRYYDLKSILSKKAQYNIIFGERSNGKTYAVLKYALEEHEKNGSQLAIVRRFQDDFTGKRGATMFDAIAANGEITRITGGKWSGVYYYGSRWFLCRFEDGKRVTDEIPFAYGFAITAMEHDKSTSYPNIKIILFDEFISRSGYITDEFVLFMNVISTIVRQRKDVKIFMLGNTVNKYCPYFEEMGIKHIKKMLPGDIDIYRYGDSELLVAVEYVKPNKRGKESDLYFAFDNPKLQMITGGAWEIDIYPHCPVKYKPKNVVFNYYIVFSGDVLHAEIIYIDDITFTFIHRKTTPLNYEKDYIYTTEYSPRPNVRRNITKPRNTIDQKICAYYLNDKVFYADNEVGEIMRNYLLWCNKGGK